MKLFEHDKVDNRSERKGIFRISTVQIIPISFLLTIIIGTILLMLPVSTVHGEDTGITTALFTSTTSLCVTGLVVVDTYSHWTFFGQLVILLLAQIGGLGVVAVGSMIKLIGRKKFSLGERKLLGDSLNIEKNRGLIHFLKRIFKGVFLVEMIGALLYAFKFVPMFGFWEGLWVSLFHSVSAFCNAGMDLIGPNSMIDHQNSVYLMSITMILIVLGGLGFVVWFDVIDGLKSGIRNRRPVSDLFGHLPVHSKVVLTMTAFLITAGTVCILASEYNNPDTIGNMPFSQKILNSMFQSITFRTAGFASIPQDKLTETSCLVGYILMFIGGSPVGTAGGIKTVTAFLVCMNAISYVREKKENVIFNRRVSEELMRKASAIVLVSFCTVFIMTILLMSRGGIVLTDALYEVISALGTVGLSRGLTPQLDTWGRIIITVSMYLGRIGPISMAIFFAKVSVGENSLLHAKGTFYVG